MSLLRGLHAKHLGDSGKLVVEFLDAGGELVRPADIDDLAGGFQLGRDGRIAGDGEIARGQPADYWGIGPLNGTSTKADAGTALGLEGATALVRRAGGRPCVVIGGVQPEDVVPAMRAGFAGVAVVSGILAASDAREASRSYRAPS